MTEKEKRTILDMRAAGKQYKEISAVLGIEVSALKVFVHRQKHKDVRRCELCKKVLPKDARKTQRFCSDKCRNDWWYSHQGELQGERLTTFICAVCGKGFTSYKQAKYCSEHVSTHQDDHNHQRHVAAFFVVEINSQTQDSMSKRKVAISKRRGI